MGDVDAARGDVGGNHHLHRLDLEILQHLGALALAQFAMKWFGLNARLAQLVGHDFGGVLGRYEHQHTLPFFCLHQVAQQLRATAGIDLYGAMRDLQSVFPARLHFDAQRVVQHALRQRLSSRRKSGREKQVLTLRWQQAQNATQLFAKAQIQQAVGLIQHQRAHCGEVQGVVIDQVQQTPRRGHHDVGAAAQVHHLTIDGNAAKDHRHLHPLRQVFGQADQGFANLRRQLACRHQHQRANAARRAGRCLDQLLQHGQRKRGRFA